MVSHHMVPYSLLGICENYNMTLTLTLPPTFLKILLLGLMSVGPKPVGRQKNLWGQNLWGQKKPVVPKQTPRCMCHL